MTMWKKFWKWGGGGGGDFWARKDFSYKDF